MATPAVLHPLDVTLSIIVTPGRVGSFVAKNCADRSDSIRRSNAYTMPVCESLQTMTGSPEATMFKGRLGIAAESTAMGLPVSSIAIRTLPGESCDQSEGIGYSGSTGACGTLGYADGNRSTLPLGLSAF